MNVYAQEITTTRGRCRAAATGNGLIAVRFPGRDGKREPVPERCISPPEFFGLLDRLERDLNHYFRGEPEDFSSFPVDYGFLRKTGWSAFSLDVFECCRRIQWGRTAGYGEVARWMGNPSAARAVGSALKTNPLPFVVPCHRVIRASGELGGYRWGRSEKEALLVMEGAASSMRLRSYPERGEYR